LNDLSSDNEIKKKEKRNKFKKILNIEKLRRYKRLLTLILKKKSRLYNTKSRD